MESKRKPRARRGGSGRPTQADVAREAGVSAAIVSVVVNGREDGAIRVGARTRERVWEAVRKLGYVPNPVARSLAGGKNRLLGVFTYEPVFPIEHPNFYYPFLVGIEEEAQAREYDLVLFTRTDRDGRRCVYRNGVNQLQVADGAIMFGTGEDRAELVRLSREGFPFVFIGRREVGDAELSYVAADYVEATRRVVRHLYELGHRRIALVRGRFEHEVIFDRRQGYREAHEELDLPYDPDLVAGVGKHGVTAELVNAQLARGVTAMVTEGSALCEELLAVAAELDLRLPEDLSVASLGNLIHEIEVPLGVTRFEVPRREMGRRALQLLDEILAHPDAPEPRRVTLRCRLVEGRTTGPPPDRPLPRRSAQKRASGPEPTPSRQQRSKRSAG